MINVTMNDELMTALTGTIGNNPTPDAILEVVNKFGTFGRVAVPKVASTKRADQNEANRKLVERIMNLKDLGNSYKQIAKILNQDGVRTARGNEFESSTVSQLVHAYKEEISGSDENEIAATA